jgi:hypothetical protein
MDLVKRTEAVSPTTLNEGNIVRQAGGWMQASVRTAEILSHEPSGSDERDVQLFLGASFRFKTISMRESKLETLRVCDLAPSFSACNS